MEVKCSGTITFTGSLESMFFGCTNLITADLSGFNTSGVTIMDMIFRGCKNLTTAYVSNWDTSNVTDMGMLFDGCLKLSSVDVSGWDTSKVKNMGSMFDCCQFLESVGLENWNVQSLENMNSMFAASGVKELDLSGWVCPNLQRVAYLCSQCENLEKFYAPNLVKASVTDLAQLFYECHNLVDVDLSGWDTSGVTRMNHVFYNCYKLTSVDDIFDWNVQNVTAFNSMFEKCSSLQQLDLSGWKADGVIAIGYMFRGCSKLTNINIGGLRTPELIHYAELFARCSKLTSIDISGLDASFGPEFNETNGYDMRDAFGSASISSVVLGETNPFKSRSLLPTPPYSQDGVMYTRKWIREDGTMGPYTSTELWENYDPSFAGKWVWEKVPVEYNISFTCEEENCVGSMPSVVAIMDADYVLPHNIFAVFGKVFDHWTDGNGRNYNDEDTIPANTYDGSVTLTAVFAPRDTAVQMQNGAFEFSIYANEKAFFDRIPAGTAYQVTEKTPEDWVLIRQSDATGMIRPLLESEALFVNKYQPGIATVQFVGKKLMDEQPADADQFDFELWEGNILLQTKPVTDGGFVVFDLIEYDKNDEGQHQYIIREVVGSDDHILYDGHEEQITVDVTTETTENGTKVFAEVTYDEDNVIFKNWTKPGTLTLKKLVDVLQNGHESDLFTFRIIFKQENGLPLNDTLHCTIAP